MTQQKDQKSPWEVPDEEPKQPEIVLPESAEVPAAKQQLAVYEKQADALVPTDDKSLRSCAEFIEQCKLAEKRVEEKREALVGPLNKQVKDINAVLIPVRDAFEAAWKKVDIRVCQFVEAKRLEAEEAQRRANEKAERDRAELDRKADEQRQAAAAAEAGGDTKGAIKAVSQAMALEQKSAATVAPIVDLQSKAIDLGTSTLSTKAPKKDWNLPGWDKKKALPAMDPSLAPLVGDVSKLPEGIRFLLQYSDLNPVRLNAAYKGGVKFPKPFGEGQVYGGSSLRSA